MTSETRGRPREHDRDQIAIDMIEWAKHPGSINLNKFCCTREPPIAPSKITEWARADTSFRLAYEEAKAFLGARREEMLTSNMLHVKAYDLNATTYDHFLKDERRQNAEFENDLSKQNQNTIADEVVKGLDAFTRQVSVSHSDLKIAKSKSKADT